MKTLILYATKHGATQEIAKQIADKMDDAVLHNLKDKNIPALSDYDCIVIGSSLYAGMIRKEAKAFLAEKVSEMSGKRIGLFLSGMDTDTEKQNECFTVNFSAEFLQTAKATCVAGGIFDPKKAGFAERTIYKMITKISTYTNTIDNDKLEQFVEKLKLSD